MFGSTPTLKAEVLWTLYTVECVEQLNLRSLVSISMDGPNVNWKFFELLQREHAEQYGGAQLVVVGSCGLHTLHNAFKCGFSMWQLEKVLRAMHFLFHNVPARREDFTALTKSLSLLTRFVKRELLQDITPLQLIRLDVADQKNWVCLKKADLGLGAEAVLKELQRSNSVGELTVLEFRNDCLKGMSNIIKKVQDKSPQKYPTVRQMACLDPTVIQPYPELWAFCKKVLLLSHGQATVERGFSINKEELLTSVGSARSKYREYLDLEKRKRQTTAQGQKRKATEDHIAELKKKKKTLLEVSDSLEKDADKFAEQAEGKSGTLMAQLITKSNVLRKRFKEKISELKQVEAELESKAIELRLMP
ncbi:hypothetical protein COCON_G00212250 [Conger conger]|uniref:Uncharacterized protein n=1 Tax=Conger conger TaxID=82655 RepID=A0A9Q1HP12_CONCO|nr:hypothetical protein COCON_G00212250 [Conger conger]